MGTDQASLSRKRKADSIGRSGVVNNDSECTAGRGSVTGWTTCPLCGRFSNKKFALGRGIAAHLHAVHTPWKPGKIERKRRKCIKARKDAESRREGNLVETLQSEEKEDYSRESWEPSREEVEEWDAKVAEIVCSVEKEKNRNPGESYVPAGFDRSGNEVRDYKDSLPTFIRAAANGDLDRLQQMIKSAKGDGTESLQKLIETRDRHESSAEHWAAGGGHLDCLKLLLTMRRTLAPEKSQSETALLILTTTKKARRRDGKTSLHYAARNGQLACARYLVEDVGVDVAVESGDGTTPLHLACFGGHFAMVEYLASQGADVMKENEWGCSSAHWMGMTRNDDGRDEVRKIARFLLDRGVSFAKRQKQGHSAMHKAAQKLNRNTLEWILQTKAEDGAGLSVAERKQASEPDDGGHTPHDIWLSMGGDQPFADWMLSRLP